MTNFPFYDFFSLAVFFNNLYQGTVFKTGCFPEEARQQKAKYICVEQNILSYEALPLLVHLVKGGEAKL